jgi:hypothetical protein
MIDVRRWVSFGSDPFIVALDPKMKTMLAH